MTFSPADIAKFRPPIRPRDETNVVQFWGFFSERELSDNSGALLMMDVDFGRKCSLKCPSCFRRKNRVDDGIHRDISYEELMTVIDDARDMGLRVIKICGAGEPLENRSLLRFARDLTLRGIGLSVFTKAHVLGDDAAIAEMYGIQGITDASSLCKEFFQLNTSFLEARPETGHQGYVTPS